VDPELPRASYSKHRQLNTPEQCGSGNDSNEAVHSEPDEKDAAGDHACHNCDNSFEAQDIG
jgi:hypothetical protein